MPSMMRRCGAFGCPVQGFSGGRCGSRRRHCASVKSPLLTQPIWDHRPETSALRRHALVREVLARHLADRGYAVMQAPEGATALALLEAGEAVDALVSDLSMPRMNGVALIREARRRRPGLPALLLTGF